MSTIASLGGLSTAPAASTSSKPEDPALRAAFDSFVGETFFGQMLDSMRKTVGNSPYFNGGQAEKAFTEQLDQVLSEKLTKASAHSFTGPMFELFSLQRT